MRFTTERYEQMVERGILTEDDRVELIDGEILEMAPSSPAHAHVVATFNERLSHALFGRATVHVQLPLGLPPVGEPEPDISVLIHPQDRYRHRHPNADDVLLVIEAGRTSLRRDRTQKLPAYARAGIPELWIVDVTANNIEVYREPSGDGYASTTIVERGGHLTPLAFPDVTIAVDDVLP